MRTILKICAVLAVGHGLILLGLPHVLHKMLAMRVGEIAAGATIHSDRFVRDAILTYAHEKKIPLESTHLVVWRSDGNVRIWLEYDQEIHFPLYTYRVSFHQAYPAGTELPRSYLRRRSVPGR